MVRAGVVKHPLEWPHGGYTEIQDAPRRYRIIDRVALMHLLGISYSERLSQAHCAWVEEALKARERVREKRWTESIAVGDLRFLENVKDQMGGRALGRKVVPSGEGHELREMQASYNGHSHPRNAALSYENRLSWRVYYDKSI